MSKIAILVDQMFEDSEFRIPYDRLREAGHDVEVVGLEAGAMMFGKHRKDHVTIERSVSQASEHDYDALVVPGGYSPDHLRTDPDAVRFTRAIALANKPVAAVCHAPSLLIEADLAYGRQLTSWPSIKTDLVNAGAYWIDREVVVDGNLITSRKPDDLPAFTTALLRQLTSGVPQRATPSVPPTAPPEPRSAAH